MFVSNRPFSEDISGTMRAKYRLIDIKRRESKSYSRKKIVYGVITVKIWRYSHLKSVTDEHGFFDFAPNVKNKSPSVRVPFTCILAKLFAIH